jgi:hypothetical protein
MVLILAVIVEHDMHLIFTFGQITKKSRNWYWQIGLLFHDDFYSTGQ